MDDERGAADRPGVGSRSEASIEALLALGRDVIALLDETGRVKYLTRSVGTLTGFGSEHYIDRDLTEELHPDDLAPTFEAWMKVVHRPGATVLTEFRMRHREDGWRWMECHITNRTDELGVAGYLSNMHDITAQRRAREQLRFQARLLASVGESVVASDPDGRCIYWNDAAAELYGWSADEALGRPVVEVIDVVELDAHRREVAHSLLAGRAWHGELLIRRRDGTPIPVNVGHTPMSDDAGGRVGVISVSSNATEKWAARRQLQAQADMQAEVARIGQLALGHSDLQAVLDAVVVGAVEVLGLHVATFVQLDDDLGGVIRAARASLPLTPGTPVSARQRQFLGHLVPHLHEPVVIDDMEAETRFGPYLLTGEDLVATMAAVRVLRRGEPYGVLSVYGTDPRRWHPDEVLFLRNLANIVASAVRREDDETELVNLALHDALTGLPNRSLLADRLEHASARVSRDGGALAVLLVDLDGFKVVNDALGHLVGDRLLVTAAERLRGATRTSDTVARLGGDEFAVLCEDITGVAEAAAVASRIAERMADPFRLGDTETFVTASIGITVRTGVQTSADVLLREADAAMYRAKESGRARYEIFDDEMRREAVHRLELTTALRRAVERDEFRLLWQPELPLAVGASGLWAEALLRWEHPEHGLLAPDQFIELAEESGLIVPIGSWVLREACQTLQRWDAAGGPVPERIAVNLSARQLAQPDLVEHVAAVLRDTGVAPARIILEITETAVMADPRGSVRRLDGLRALGLGLAIDDFGTGYSSLTYLRQLPVNALKIDRSFVQGIAESHEDRAIARGILELARAVGLLTVAEGVETEAQRLELVALGCDWAQGYLWSRPVPADELQRWMADRAMAALDEVSGAGPGVGSPPAVGPVAPLGAGLPTPGDADLGRLSSARRTPRSRRRRR